MGWLLPGLPSFDPIDNGLLAERLSEFAVIVSLMGVGLKLDRPLGWKTWISTRRLLFITMPLSIAALAWGGFWLLGLPLAAAVLLGAVLAPSDPVLASGVQVGPPGTGDEDELRFALTSEAGLNDGLAFPFVNLALVLAATGFLQTGLVEWFVIDFVWKILAGVACGAIVGHYIAVLVSKFYQIKPITEGFIAIALTLFSYGLTELVYGYGFLGVFVAALMFRRYEREHEHHKTLHEFSEQLEQIMMAIILVMLGIAIGQGLFAALTWQAATLGIATLLLIRPAAGMIGLAGTSSSLKTRSLISWFGIRGIGTFYYLAYGVNRAGFEEPYVRTIWALTGFIVLISIFLHGVTSYYLLEEED